MATLYKIKYNVISPKGFRIKVLRDEKEFHEINLTSIILSRCFEREGKTIDNS